MSSSAEREDNDDSSQNSQNQEEENSDDGDQPSHYIIDTGDGEIQLDAAEMFSLLTRYLIRRDAQLDGDDDDDDSTSDEEESQPSGPFQEVFNREEMTEALRNHDFGSDVSSRCHIDLNSRKIPSLTDLLATHQTMWKPHTPTAITQRFLVNKSIELDQYTQQTFCGKYSKSGALFMSACQDRHIRLYDTLTWRLVKDIVAQDVGWSIISVDYSPDDNWVIYSSWSPYVHLYNTKGPAVYRALDYRPSSSRFCLFSSEFSPLSTEILSGASDHCVYLYDLERNERTHRIAGHDDDVNAICWLDDSGQLFASGSDDRLVCVWDRRLLDSGAEDEAHTNDFVDFLGQRQSRPSTSLNARRGCVGAFVGHQRGVTCVSARGDGRYLLSNGKDHCAKLWDLRHTSPQVEARQAARAIPSMHYDYRRGGRRMPTSMRLHTRDTSLMSYFGGHQVYNTLLRAHFSPLESTGSKYVYAASSEGGICIYETLTGRIVKRLEDGHTNLVRDVSWHPYRPELVSTSWDGTCRVWCMGDLPEALEERKENNDYVRASMPARPRGLW